MTPESELRLRELCADVLALDPTTIDDTTSTDTVEGWDSLAHMNLILALEEAFDISIPDEEAADVTSYALIRLVVAEQLSAAAS
jgi:acyl carrier protein